MPLSYIEFIGHLAYALIFLSFSVRNMLRLRIIAILASIAVIFFSMYIVDKVLWIPIYWNLAFIMMNTFQISVLLWQRRSVILNEQEVFLQTHALRGFSSAELKSFLRIAKKVSFSTEHLLIKQGDKQRDLYLIESGAVGVRFKEREIARLLAGSFVGEMSLLTNSPARADVHAIEPVVVYAWDRPSLESWLAVAPHRQGLLQAALGGQLIDQLMQRSA